jgi:uncharacterized protein Yka (UPF0111/DUF47 family)
MSGYTLKIDRDLEEYEDVEGISTSEIPRDEFLELVKELDEDETGTIVHEITVYRLFRHLQEEMKEYGDEEAELMEVLYRLLHDVAYSTSGDYQPDYWKDSRAVDDLRYLLEDVSEDP